MWLTDQIFSLVWDISAWFYEAFQEVKDWVWPFHYLAPPLYYIHRAFFDMLTPIAQLGDWADEVTTEIGRILGMGEIALHFKYWLDRAAWSWDWIGDAWRYVWDMIDSWWSSTSSTVLAWIDQAVSNTVTLINQVEASLGDLRSSWSGFWTVTWPEMSTLVSNIRLDLAGFLTVTLPGLATWTGVESFVNSQLTNWFPFYDELAAAWGEIREFMINPWDWLLAHFVDWFLGTEV